MTDLAREHIRIWLRDAHAIEKQAEQLFSAQTERMIEYRDLQKKLLLEVNYAKERQVTLSIRIQQLGSSTSIIKDVGAKLIASIQNLSGFAMEDEPVKATLALHTFTQMAIGSYQILIAAALKVGDDETFKVCKFMLSQSQTRALWIEDQLASVTQAFITKSD